MPAGTAISPWPAASPANGSEAFCSSGAVIGAPTSVLHTSRPDAASSAYRRPRPLPTITKRSLPLLMISGAVLRYPSPVNDQSVVPSSDSALKEPAAKVANRDVESTAGA